MRNKARVWPYLSCSEDDIPFSEYSLDVDTDDENNDHGSSPSGSPEGSTSPLH